ncbi:MAG: AAA family ATPase [Synergistaceae bacterium]|jgi:predicted ATP-dependent endonuclease of OLD family|nr:AAA family ATPase [Synergistaceae bacterium]
MPLSKISLENFTVFEKLEIPFTYGVNVFIGENSTGKTHILKLLYSACQSARQKVTAVDFPQKTARTFRPDELSLHRLVRHGSGNSAAKITICSEHGELSLSFDAKHKKNIETRGEETWNAVFSNRLSTFIPAKEILSHSRNLLQAIDQGNVDFDDTYKDIVSAASVDLKKGPESEKTKKYLDTLSGITKGRVEVHDEEFYLCPNKQDKLEFQLVAEGLRKIALLWQLIKNGTLEKGAILFWDEPEANINPRNIPFIVDMLLNLQRDGVQIFLATHDYMFAKYLEVRKGRAEGTIFEDDIMFHAFYREGGETGPVRVEQGESFTVLENNSIVKQSIDLYKEEVERVMR